MNFGPCPVNLSGPLGGAQWEKWFAWKPVKVHEKYVWLKTVYRYMPEPCWPRPNDVYVVNSFTWVYGTIFDVIATQ